MKKYLLILFIAATVLNSCEFDDIDVSYGTTSAFFWNQNYNRNVVVGEGLKFKPGIVLSGLVANDKNRVVKYIIDPSLVTGSTKSILPSKYYTLGHPTDIVIKAGEFIGYLDVKLDSVAFLSDPKSLTGEYVLPVKLIGSNDVDSINASKNYMLESISYWAKQHGNYYYSGSAVKKTAGTTVSTVNYEDFKNTANSIRQLLTVNPTTLKIVADKTAPSIDPAKNKYSFYLSVSSLGGGNVVISSDPSSTIVVSPNGTSSYDEASKTFTLNYKYKDGANDMEISEKMVFRNRIRDVQADGNGVNEYRGF
jgi:hypothetical protein